MKITVEEAINFLDELELEHGIDLEYYKDAVMKHKDHELVSVHYTDEHWSIECESCYEVIVDKAVVDTIIEEEA